MGSGARSRLPNARAFGGIVRSDAACALRCRAGSSHGLGRAVALAERQSVRRDRALRCRLCAQMPRGLLAWARARGRACRTQERSEVSCARMPRVRSYAARAPRMGSGARSRLPNARALGGIRPISMVAELESSREARVHLPISLAPGSLSSRRFSHVVRGLRSTTMALPQAVRTASASCGKARAAAVAARAPSTA